MDFLKKKIINTHDDLAHKYRCARKIRSFIAWISTLALFYLIIYLYLHSDNYVIHIMKKWKGEEIPIDLNTKLLIALSTGFSIIVFGIIRFLHQEILLFRKAGSEVSLKSLEDKIKSLNLTNKDEARENNQASGNVASESQGDSPIRNNADQSYEEYIRQRIREGG